MKNLKFGNCKIFWEKNAASFMKEQNEEKSIVKPAYILKIANTSDKNIMELKNKVLEIKLTSL